MGVAEWVAANLWTLVLPSAVAALYFAYSAVEFATGNRHEAVGHVVAALSTVVLSALVLLAVPLVNVISFHVLGAAGSVEAPVSPILVETPEGARHLSFSYWSFNETLGTAAWVFGRAKNASATWLMLRAAAVVSLETAPVVYGLGGAVGGATAWADSLMELATSVFAGMESASQALLYAHPFLLALGVAMFFTPRLTSIGAALLSFLVAFGVALNFSAYITYSILSTTTADLSFVPGMGETTVLGVPEPTDSFEIAATGFTILPMVGAQVGTAANALFESAVTCVVAMLFASLLAWAASSALGGLAPFFLRWRI